ncbi:MAG: aa3-type cytochrome c oxidase subunit IV [Paracoccaceae bacterium]
MADCGFAARQMPVTPAWESSKTKATQFQQTGYVMAKHEHGTMDSSDHEKTFDGFVNFVKWGIILIIAFLIFLAMVNG